jgi:hypothetical protein
MLYLDLSRSTSRNKEAGKYVVKYSNLDRNNLRDEVCSLIGRKERSRNRLAVRLARPDRPIQIWLEPLSLTLHVHIWENLFRSLGGGTSDFVVVKSRLRLPYDIGNCSDILDHILYPGQKMMTGAASK